MQWQSAYKESNREAGGEIRSYPLHHCHLLVVLALSLFHVRLDLNNTVAFTTIGLDRQLMQ